MSVPSSGVGRRWYAYVDGSSGNLVRFMASSDNAGAKDRVIRSLRYREADTAFTVLMKTDQKEHSQTPSRRLTMRKIVELYNLTIEGLEGAHKICKRDVDCNFLSQFPDFSQLSICSISELIKRVKGTYIYEKKYHEDPEWQFCGSISGFVDQLLQRKNQMVVRDIVDIARREGFMEEAQATQFSHNQPNLRTVDLVGDDSQSAGTSPCSSFSGRLFPQTSQSGSRVRSEVLLPPVHEVAFRSPDGCDSSFGDRPDEPQIQSSENLAQDDPPSMPDDNEDLNSSDGEVTQPEQRNEMQMRIDELKNEIRNFICLQISSAGTDLHKLCCDFLADKAKSCRTYEIGEKGKTIGELFYSHMRRKFKTADRKLQMANSREISAKQFINIFKSAVNVVKVSSQEKQFIVEVTARDEKVCRWSFDMATKQLKEMVSEEEN
ncbi:MAG: hypothetical protein LBE98_01950 [Puniceicoccales bacterium]|jgi:hypothetical protein|nr:hypothetical protein [Puniceicoccales bacterium]